MLLRGGGDVSDVAEREGCDVHEEITGATADHEYGGWGEEDRYLSIQQRGSSAADPGKAKSERTIMSRTSLDRTIFRCLVVVVEGRDEAVEGARSKVDVIRTVCLSSPSYCEAMQASSLRCLRILPGRRFRHRYSVTRTLEPS